MRPVCCVPETVCQHWPQGMPLPRTYHKDIGFPVGLDVRPPKGLWLYYTAHAKRAAREEGHEAATLPSRLPEGLDIIEVEVVGDSIQKWVLRDHNTGYRGGRSIRELYDLVLVILLDGTVKTLWLNHRGDTHSTLQKHRYAVPSAPVLPGPKG